ncbi:hypothetical protein TorRG33x02_292980, partial [Trema orientale]
MRQGLSQGLKCKGAPPFFLSSSSSSSSSLFSPASPLFSLGRTMKPLPCPPPIAVVDWDPPGTSRCLTGDREPDAQGHRMSSSPARSSLFWLQKELTPDDADSSHFQSSSWALQIRLVTRINT